LSTTEPVNVRSTLASALSGEDVNDLGRTTAQAERLRTVTPRRLCLAMVSTPAGAKVESLADVLRALNDQNGVHVEYKAFYNRLARLGFAVLMLGVCLRLVEQLRVTIARTEHDNLFGVVRGSGTGAVLVRLRY